MEEKTCCIVHFVSFYNKSFGVFFFERIKHLIFFPVSLLRIHFLKKTYMTIKFDFLKANLNICKININNISLGIKKWQRKHKNWNRFIYMYLDTYEKNSWYFYFNFFQRLLKSFHKIFFKFFNLSLNDLIIHEKIDLLCTKLFYVKKVN